MNGKFVSVRKTGTSLTNEQEVAIIHFPNSRTENKPIIKINLIQNQKNLSFKCKRCATFCCKLGGPRLLDLDVERIKRAGYDLRGFLEGIPKNGFKAQSKTSFNLKNKKHGSCVFLEYETEKGVYNCSIYDFRPTLCRLYPFDFERIGLNSFVLKFIPCCRGLNDSNGELVNERFILNRLFDAMKNVLMSNKCLFRRMEFVPNTYS